MGYDSIPYEKRVKENIRNYSLGNLYDMEIMKSYLSNLAQVLEINILLTDRHGEKEVVIGDSFLGFHPDVVNDPGRKIRVQNRTVGHLYINPLNKNRDERLIGEMVDETVQLFARLGDKQRAVEANEREDVLTGVFNKLYFDNKMKVIDRSEVVPIAVLNVNINDWKFVNDHYGDEESDRLIAVVAGILKEEANPYFVIGRIDGDVFGVLIPMAEEGEAEDYAKRIQDKCLAYEDPRLAPSVAVGIVYKTNVEETLEAKLSDAEYEMFDNKFEIKNAPGYRERLQKGI